MTLESKCQHQLKIFIQNLIAQVRQQLPLDAKNETQILTWIQILKHGIKTYRANTRIKLSISATEVECTAARRQRVGLSSYRNPSLATE